MTTNFGETAAETRFHGKHVLGELAASSIVLDDLPLLERVLAETLTDAGATVLQVTGKKFEPHGVTVVALLAESHASLHTYPEDELAFFDLFTCGPSADPIAALKLLVERLLARIITSETILRGHDCETVSSDNQPADERSLK